MVGGLLSTLEIEAAVGQRKVNHLANSLGGLEVVCSREGGSQSRFLAAAFLVHLTTPDRVLAGKLLRTG